MAKLTDMPCSVPSCDRNAKLRSEGRPVCNRHYQLWRTRGTFSNVPRMRTYYECSVCGAGFEINHAMTNKRRAMPKYCSKVCRDKTFRERSKRNFPKRFWSKVKIAGPDECWEWQGMLTKAGYGYINAGRSVTPLAHRHSYMLTHSTTLEPKQLVCHSCDNPKCVNPKHLWLGDDRANHEDCVAKGRHVLFPVKRGSDVNTSKLSENQAREVLNSTASGANLARKFGVSKTAIYKIRSGENWAHLQGAS